VILTGSAITEANAAGRIRITPFANGRVNPNSYNLRLGPALLTYRTRVLDPYRQNPTRRREIGERGFVLRPGRLYLGHTIEECGSDHYVPLLFGRSSVGRLGLFVEITAPIGDLGYHGQWTLMLHSIRPLRVYTGMTIAQVMFFATLGQARLYAGKYQGSTGPQASRYWIDRLPAPRAAGDAAEVSR